MAWPFVIVIIFACLLILFATGMPILFAFIIIDIAGMLIYFGPTGVNQFIRNIYSGTANFTIICLPLFILMGEILFESGVGPVMLDALDRWLGRIPGRLGLLAVGAGTLFATMTGVSVGSVAMLGNVLVPEMEKRGYKKEMSLGPILGSGGLAVMIPPSGLAIILGAVAQVSIGKILIAIIVPGLLMAIIYAAYIILRCRLNPALAPSYEVSGTPWREKLRLGATYILPAGFIILLVTGVILLGIATPTESAATGAIGMFILAAAYRRLSWKAVKRAVSGTIQVTGMILIIISGAMAFGSVLAFSGAAGGLAGFVTALPISPILVVIGMNIVILILGCFMESVSLMMITAPIFIPIIIALKFDPVWFSVIYLLNIETGLISPPFGLSLFVMKGVATPDTTMRDVYMASLPFFGMNILTMAIIIAFPLLALWLPGFMR